MRRKVSRSGTTLPFKYLFSLVLLGLMVGYLLPSPLFAHPFSARFWSHQLLLQASPTLLTVDLEVEVPTPFVMREFFALLGGAEPSPDDDRRFTGARLDDLRQNLRLLVDGTPLTLTDITSTTQPNGVGNSNFFVYHLKLQAPWSPVVGQVYQVEVVDTSDADRELYFRHSVRSEGGMEVVASSTWDPVTSQERPAGEAWSQDPQQRNLLVSVMIPGKGERRWREVKEGFLLHARWVGGALFGVGLLLLLRGRRSP